MSGATWYCCRQRAGPLVKECRALRPRFSGDDPPETRRDKNDAKRHIRTAVNRSTYDRLELRLAAIGWDATHYVLTFDDEHLPASYGGAQTALRSFVKAARRWRKRRGKPPDFDWLAVIEGKHGDRRWHVHFVCDYYELCPEEVLRLWRYGLLPSDAEQQIGTPVLMDKQGFRRLAEYLGKEARPVGKRAFSCSRSLDAKICPPRRWTSGSGAIRLPKRAVCPSLRNGKPEQFRNNWGAFCKLSWLVPDGTVSCLRALRRMGCEV